MQSNSRGTKRSHASQHTIDTPIKAGKMNPVESPPPSAILTQAKILQRPPQAPKRKQRPSNKKNSSGDDCGHGNIDHDYDDLDMPHLAALPRRKLFVDDEPTTATTMSTTNTTLFPAISDPNRKRFRPIQPDRENERRQVQQEDRLSPSRREERAD
jgi:hypothetical protein